MSDALPDAAAAQPPPARAHATALGVRLWLRSALWLAALLGLAQLYVALAGMPFGRALSGWRLLGILTGQVGLLLPFAMFAGGLAVGGGRAAPPPPGRVAPAALGLAVVAWLALAVASPVAEHRAGLEAGREHPSGAATPYGLVREIASLSEAPPPAPAPEGRPPRTRNLAVYDLHLPAVLAAFGLLNVLVGMLTAELTSGLSPPLRRQLRWAAGLAGGVLFFSALVAADGWLRSSPAVPGSVTAWVPLAVPAAVAAILAVLVRRRRARLHALGPARVS